MAIVDKLMERVNRLEALMPTGDATGAKKIASVAEILHVEGRADMDLERVIRIEARFDERDHAQEEESRKARESMDACAERKVEVLSANVSALEERRLDAPGLSAEQELLLRATFPHARVGERLAERDRANAKTTVDPDGLTMELVAMKRATAALVERIEALEFERDPKTEVLTPAPDAPLQKLLTDVLHAEIASLREELEAANLQASLKEAEAKQVWEQLRKERANDELPNNYGWRDDDSLRARIAQLWAELDKASGATGSDADIDRVTSSGIRTLREIRRRAGYTPELDSGFPPGRASRPDVIAEEIEKNRRLSEQLDNVVKRSEKIPAVQCRHCGFGFPAKLPDCPVCGVPRESPAAKPPGVIATEIGDFDLEGDTDDDLYYSQVQPGGELRRIMISNAMQLDHTPAARRDFCIHWVRHEAARRWPADDSRDAAPEAAGGEVTTPRQKKPLGCQMEGCTQGGTFCPRCGSRLIGSEYVTR